MQNITVFLTSQNGLEKNLSTLNVAKDMKQLKLSYIASDGVK